MDAQPKFNLHQTVTVKAGKLAGLVGTVEGVDPGTGSVHVRVAGVVDDLTIDELRWFRPSSLETFRG